MTALSQYQRLESPGLWRATSSAQRRDVIVSFGEASLVISDNRAQALTHWSLAAVTRLNPGATPALYTPGDDSEEQLEIDDTTMIAAIEKVRAAIARTRPRQGRLRLIVMGSALMLVLAVLVFWMPGALRRHTVAAVPATIRANIGQSLLADITRLSGAACHSPGGDKALARLARRLLPGGGSIVVLPSGLSGSAHLPGQIVLLGRSVVEDHEDASVAAGFILAERSRATMADPLNSLLWSLGPVASLKLLTTGGLPRASLQGYAEALLTKPPARVPDDMLLARFATARVPSTPYAYALDVSGETVLPLIEGDPMRGKVFEPLLSDADWIRLQAICGG